MSHAPVGDAEASGPRARGVGGGARRPVSLGSSRLRFFRIAPLSPAPGRSPHPKSRCPGDFPRGCRGRVPAPRGVPPAPRRLRRCLGPSHSEPHLPGEPQGRGTGSRGRPRPASGPAPRLPLPNGPSGPHARPAWPRKPSAPPGDTDINHPLPLKTRRCPVDGARGWPPWHPPLWRAPHNLRGNLASRGLFKNPNKDADST